jgi:N-acetylneuraminic acid mutarotase
MRSKYLIGMVSLILVSCSSSSATTPSLTTETLSSPTQPITASATPDLSARGVWIQRQTMPTARSEMPAVVLNGLIYVPGGFGPVRGGLANGKGPVNTLHAYDPITDQWKALAPMPEPRHHEMVTVYKEHIYVFGGFVDPWITQSNVWVYDPAMDHWDVLKSMPAPRTAGAAVALGDYIYLVGGTASPPSVILPT